MSWLYHTNSLGSRVDRRLHRWSLRSLRSLRTATGRRVAGVTDRGVLPGVEPALHRQDAKGAKNNITATKSGIDGVLTRRF